MLKVENFEHEEINHHHQSELTEAQWVANSGMPP